MCHVDTILCNHCWLPLKKWTRMPMHIAIWLKWNRGKTFALARSLYRASYYVLQTWSWPVTDSTTILYKMTLQLASHILILLFILMVGNVSESLFLVQTATQWWVDSTRGHHFCKESIDLKESRQWKQGWKLNEKHRWKLHKKKTGLKPSGRPSRIRTSVHKI